MSKFHSIALVTDFFYPSIGGVETHVKMIGEELIKLGHSVIVITHKYTNYLGYMKIGMIDVYYADLPVLCPNNVLPTVFPSLPFYKEIFNMHKVDIVHGHQSMSSMCLEAVFHANHLGIKTILTDHSVFEFGKIERIICDNLYEFVCKHVDKFICVSEIAKINTAKRMCFPIDNIEVIPNGILPKYFYPKLKSSTILNTKTIVLFCARFVFRKGIDLFIQALPYICKDKSIEVRIIGTGPKRDEILEVIDLENLYDQVILMDEVDHTKVPDAMRCADIFLNTSLTETFCMAILEAAACGLFVVSTNVGGIKEVLDENMIRFCQPVPEKIAEEILYAKEKLKSYNPIQYYDKLIKKYNWGNIALRTAQIYNTMPEKRIKFVNLYNGFTGFNNFLLRFGTWLEFLQIRIINWLKPKKNTV